MKQAIQNNTINTAVLPNGNNAQVAKSRLYNLLFTGKITLKEYLQVAKEME